MSRIPLNHGDTIQLNNRQYTIDSVIGDGATCIVYSAYYTDNMGLPHRVNIKECYPYNANITRNGQKLYWDSEEEKSKSIVAFCNAYEKLMVCQNGNFTVHAFDICEENQTQYIVMDANSGVTFDKDTSASLSDILKTVRLLAYVIDNYHKNGYLHLDIKPSNFLVYPRPSEHIVLFDMDTVTLIDDISSGKVKCVSYSDGWAAPEQKQGKISKLCPATDIYAIGAVLFEKIMDRPVDAADMGIFADWDFDGELFENINPKIKRLLRNIFRKTLSANIKRRYQSASEIIKDLIETIKTADSDVFLKGDDICCSGCFFGRQNELALIKTFFDSKKKAVFLHGFGGIGKTEIARRYAQLNSKHYDTVLFVKYNKNETLQDLLNEIEIVNFDTDDSKERWRKLRTLLDEHTLVIIDNFDIEIGTDNGLKALFETKANVVVSTRTDFSTVYNGERYAQIDVGALASGELEQVFIRNAQINSISDNDRAMLGKIFKLIQNHTYATELLAKQMYYSGWTLDYLYEKLKLGFTSLENTERFITNKDENTIKDNSLNILRAVYHISELTDSQKQVLRNMSLLNFIKMTKNVYREITQSELFNGFNELIELGLIQKEKEYFSLHTLINELVNIELNPNLDICIDVYNYVLCTINWFDKQYELNDADKTESLHKATFLSCFFNARSFFDEITVNLVCKWFEFIANGDFYISDLKWEKIELEILIERLYRETEMKSLEDKRNIYYVLYKICEKMCDYKIFSKKPDMQIIKYREIMLAKCFCSLWECLEKLDDRKNLDDLTYNILKSINQPSEEESLLEVLGFSDNKIKTKNKIKGSLKMIVEKIHNYKPDLFDLTEDGEYTYYGRFWASKGYREYVKNLNNLDFDIDFLDIPEECFGKWLSEQIEFQLTHGEIPQKRIEDLAENVEFDDIEEENEHDWFGYNKLIFRDYKEVSDKYNFIITLVSNTNYSLSEKIALLDGLLYNLFEPFDWVVTDDDNTIIIEQLNSTDWQSAEYILNLMEKIYHDNDKYNWDEMDEDSISHIPKYKAMLSIWFKKDDFFDLVEEVIEVDNKKLNERGPFVIFGNDLDEIIRACGNLKKYSMVLPIMIKIAKERIATYSNEEDVRNSYPMFDMIFDYASKAIEIENLSDEKSNEYFCICEWAQTIMDKITNKSFEIKDDIEE